MVFASPSMSLTDGIRIINVNRKKTKSGYYFSKIETFKGIVKGIVFSLIHNI